MPSITVSEYVVERIQALKRVGESSEDEVLRRVLDEATAERERRFRAFEAAEQDTSSTN